MFNFTALHLKNDSGVIAEFGEETVMQTLSYSRSRGNQTIRNPPLIAIRGPRITVGFG